MLPPLSGSPGSAESRAFSGVSKGSCGISPGL